MRTVTHLYYLLNCYIIRQQGINVIHLTTVNFSIKIEMKKVLFCMNPRICSRRPGQRNLLPVQNFDRFLNFLLNCQRVLLHLETGIRSALITNLNKIAAHNLRGIIILIVSFAGPVRST